MIISITNPVSATIIFSVILFTALALSIKPRTISAWFPGAVTTELKGLAILMIVLSHIGYFLVDDTRFLWPLSIMAGVGVNLFLFLSGFGLSASQLQKPLSPWQFYKKRLLKLFVPFWLMLAVFFLMDYFLLHISYAWPVVVKAIFGIFTQADLYHDINSPLWYLTFILGYYLLFPWVFSKKFTWLSALALYLAAYLFVFFQPSAFAYILHMYKIHIIAFPLGVLAASVVAHLSNPEILEFWSHGKRAWLYYAVLAGFGGIFVYANIHSGIGVSANLEQGMSIIAVLAIAAFFIMKKFECRLLSLVGLYSYEIYLWHWPLMYRYDIFYSWLPAWLATVLYLIFFIALAWCTTRLLSLFMRPKKPVV